MTPILELRNLVKHFPGQRAVDGVSLTIPRGGFFSLVGPSGCGKTTTLRLIAGFEEPDSAGVGLPTSAAVSETLSTSSALPAKKIAAPASSRAASASALPWPGP